MWEEFIICDYIYVFDPHVNRKESYKEGSLRQNVYLIDEALI